MNKKVNIIFRTCDKINSVNGAPRPFNLDKRTLIKICFLSLMEAVQQKNIKIIIVADDISDDLKNFYSKFQVEIIHGVFGNDNSLRKCFEIAKNIADDELIYFCEDDYLHVDNTFEKIIEFYSNANHIFPGKIRLKKLLRKRELTIFTLKRYFSKPDLLVFPCDYPDRYSQEYLQRNYIFQTPTTFWRQISDITFSFIIESSVFKKHYHIFNKSAKAANDRYLSKKLLGNRLFFNSLFALSPMPSLSCHMHLETMSGIVDWESIVKKQLIALNASN